MSLLFFLGLVSFFTTLPIVILVTRRRSKASGMQVLDGVCDFFFLFCFCLQSLVDS
ncbi:hypothetical protein BDV26DRAFT_93259 [Aspergillus bertholletiae]|uniref:Uncharacterized protein n=1 Tax=Aspergillus bertholletiae TaxID=1226010 RepID=A0A5N7BPM0_9EURO|nr:hypothetical protein BDV26DRAFT_93259 [Aspergillus bertholletiae]